MSERRRIEVEPATWILLALAVGIAGWAHLDAGRDDGPQATLVSTRSSAWRILPELHDTASGGATIELWPARGEPVRLVPEGLGHRLFVGERELGPADPEAVEGVWDSLRMATTLRAVDDEADPGLGDGGRIVVGLPQGGARTIVLGRPTADGAGRYGAIEGGVAGTEGVWVLEQELAVLLDQAPETWLARRAVVAEPADVVALHEGELHLARGLDGLWRATLGPGSASLLDRVAVETRLDRLASARLDPLVQPTDDPGAPWITLEGVDGVDFELRTHGACPGRPERVLIDRGPGLWGCVHGALTEPWPVPGRPGPDPGAMLDPRLLPHDYGRVLRVELRRPSARSLRRHGGGWRIEEAVGDRTAVFDVEEAEVFRWYRALHEAEVQLDDGAAPWPEPAPVDLTVETDSTATLRVRCTDDPPIRCRRDDGPVLVLRHAVPPLAFDADTFAERRLAAVANEDVRAVEILPGSDASPVVRQSVHFDLGVWRLDAPVHPSGDGALDELALEGLLGALGSLRAESWADAPQGQVPRRRIRVERVPRRDQDPTLEVALYDGCVVEVTGHPAARLGPGPCETLGRDLLVDLPLDVALRGARQLELSRDGTTVRLRPRGEAWADDRGGPAPEANAWLAEMAARTTASLRRGAPPSPPQWTLRVLPNEGTAYSWRGGPGWLGLADAPWVYLLATEDPEDDEDPKDPSDPDDASPEDGPTEDPARVDDPAGDEASAAPDDDATTDG